MNENKQIILSEMHKTNKNHNKLRALVKTADYSNFNYDKKLAEILVLTRKDDDHLVLIENKKKDGGFPTITYEGNQRYIHHWYYICTKRCDPRIKLKMVNICDNKKCMNLEHFAINDENGAKFKKAKFHQMKMSVQDGECRKWTGKIGSKGYGSSSFNGKTYTAHRVAMMAHLKKDEINKDTVVRHKCKTKECIAIEHLELGTRKENRMDMKRDGTELIGSKHPLSKIDEKLAIEIYQSKGNGSQKDRAKRFNVKDNIVSSIDNGETWSHVTDAKKYIRIRKKTTIDENTPEQDFIDAQKRIEKNSVKIYNEERQSYDWIWSKSKDKDSYGNSSWGQWYIRAHQLSWIAFNKKPIPKGLWVLHLCIEHPDCVNPAHLYVGTPPQNTADMMSQGTHKSPKTINEETAEKIMRSKGDGTSAERAKTFGVSRELVNHIDMGTSWFDLRLKLNIPVTKRGIVIPNWQFIRDKRRSTILPKIKLKLKNNINDLAEHTKPHIKFKLKLKDN